MRRRPPRLDLIDILALLVGLAALCAASLAQAGRLHISLDIFSNFAPFWLAGAMLPLVRAVWPGRRRLRPALALVGVAGAILSGDLIAPEYLRPIRPEVAATSPHQIKLIQFNAWEKNAAPDASADWIAAQKPDVVTMEDAEAPIYLAMLQRGFKARRGIADTIVFSRRLRAPHSFAIPVEDWPLLPSFARDTLVIDGQAFDVVAVHLDRPIRGSQLGEAEVLFDILKSVNRDRVIVAGDFNLTPWSFSLRKIDGLQDLERRDRALPSWPVQWPRPTTPRFPFAFLPIDHVYAGRSWRTVKVELGPKLASAHRPLIVTLALMP